MHVRQPETIPSRVHGAPDVSVLLPVRDAKRTLPACLRSIQRQRGSNWECIVVDDGSRDGSLDCVRAVAGSDPRVVLVGGPRAGLVAALERGLDACRGRLVARMDADDVMHRDRLAHQTRALADDASLSAVGSHVRLFPRAQLGAGMRAYERWLASIDSAQRVREEAFVECPLAHPTLMIRAEVLRALRYRDRGWPEDYDLVLRLLATGHRLGVVPRRLLSWRQGAERTSVTSEVYSAARFTACKARFLADSFLAGDEHYLLWGYGGTGKALRRALERHGKRPSAIVELHPRRLGNRIHGAPVIAPEALARPLSAPLVVSVAGATARSRIRADLARRGLRETEDYVCAA